MKVRLLGGIFLLVALATAHPTVLSTSLVDLLSASSNHSLLLSAFQRARLIPTLNDLNGSTLWAPTNDAIKQEIRRERKHLQSATADAPPSLWTWATADVAEQAEDKEHDNLQLALRDTLLYHVLNYTLFPAPSNDSLSSPAFYRPSSLPLNLPTLQESLYHPSLSRYNKSFPAPPSLPGSPPDKPDPDAPDGGVEGLLRAQGQRVRLVRKGETEEDIWIGGDWKGEGGAKVQGKLQRADNGELLAIDAVLHKPVDLATHIRSNPDLSTLASLLPPAVLDYISTAPHLTLFAPTNEAWDQLSELELRYLRSGFAEQDLAEIFGDGASRDGAGGGKVGYLPELLGEDGKGSATVKTVWNNTLEITPGEDGAPALINGTAVSTPDILAMNGVIHTVPSLLLPFGTLSLTAEKYLIALNCTRFVSLLRSVNLSHYVQIPSDEPATAILPPPFSPDAAQQQQLFSTPSNTVDATKRKAYTILAPRDEVLDSRTFAPLSADWEGEEGDELLSGRALPAPGSEALKEVLEYHIVHGKWTTEDFEDGMLVGTELKGENLKGARQQLAVSVQTTETPSSEGGLFDWIGGSGKDKEKKKLDVVGFGGANVVAEPVLVGNSIIYLISSVLEPPSSVINEAVSDLRLSTFVASVYAASLDKVLSRQPAVTYLVPENNAFTSLGLVMSYLLLPLARAELRSVVRYHAIDEIVYLDEFPLGGAVRYPTLDNAEIYVERDGTNGSLTVHGPTSAGLPANGETRDARIIEGDILTSTGVIHIIDQVELPPELDITIPKLLQGARANTMVDLIRAANMSWVLDGDEPPEDDEDSFALSTSSLKKSKKRTKHRSSSSPPPRAYTVLCPTDKALSRLNLTYYLSHPPALSALVRLHIIPTDAFAPLTPDGRPLLLSDEKAYPTLLDKSEGGGSSYGKVAFRRWGEEGWLVGIKSVRGTGGQTDSARVVSYGRASPWFLDEEREPSPGGGGSDPFIPGLPLGFATPRLAAAGGVLLIDSVLLPYEPGWLRRLWILWVALSVVVVLGVAGFVGWRWWRGRGKQPYEPLEREED